MAPAILAQSRAGFQARRGPRFLAWLAAATLLCGGCTTLKSQQLPPEALQAQIRNGSIVQTGDEVNLVTRDGAEHTLIVSAVGTDAIVGTLEGGASIAVPIDDVLALRTREISAGRTALAGVGVYLLVGGVLMVVAMHDIVDDFVDALFGGLSD